MSVPERAFLLSLCGLATAFLTPPPAAAQEPLISWAIPVPSPMAVSATPSGLAVLGEVRDSTFQFGDLTIEGLPWGLLAGRVSPDGALESHVGIDIGPVPPYADVAADPAGDMYLAGRFNDTLRIGDTTVVGSTTQLLFVAKLGGEALDVEWIRAPDTKDALASLAPVVTSVQRTEESVYVLGANVDQVPAEYGGAILARFAQDGTLAWNFKARHTGRAGGGGHSVVADEEGALLVAALHARGALVGDSTVMLDHIPEGERDLTTRLLIRLNAEGELIWYRVIRGATGFTHASGSIAGGIFISGSHTDAVHLGDEVLLPAVRNEEAFLIRFEPDGALDWALQEAIIGSAINDDHEHAGYNGNAALDGTYDGQIARYEYAFTDFAVAVSAEINDDIEGDDDIEEGDPILGLGVRYATEFSGIDMAFGAGVQTIGGLDDVGEGLREDLGFESDDDDTDDITVFGLSADLEFAQGIRVIGNYSDYDDLGDHYGIAVGYEFDAFTVAANYGKFDDLPDDSEADGYGLIVNYDLGGGAELQAGDEQEGGGHARGEAARPRD